MKVLAVDTATEACSAALYVEGEIKEEFQLAPQQHTQLILKMVDTLLQQADLKVTDLDALAFGRGPGSFTGVRIATGVVQGLAFAADLPVVPVSTLASMAQYTYQQHQHEKVLSGIDARMGGMYWGCYQPGENGLMQLVGKEQVSPPEAVVLADKEQWVGAGSAWGSYTEQLSEGLSTAITHQYPEYLPHSSTIAELAAYAHSQGQSVPAAQAQPVYLRDDVAKKSKSIGPQINANKRK